MNLFGSLTDYLSLFSLLSFHFIYDFHCFKNLCFNINFSFFFSITTDTIIAILYWHFPLFIDQLHLYFILYQHYSYIFNSCIWSLKWIILFYLCISLLEIVLPLMLSLLYFNSLDNSVKYVFSCISFLFLILSLHFF